MKNILILITAFVLTTTNASAQSMNINNNINCNIGVTLYAHDGVWTTCGIDYQTIAIGSLGTYSLSNVEDWNYPGVGGVYWAPGYDIFSTMGGVWDYAVISVGGSILVIGSPTCTTTTFTDNGTDCTSTNAIADWIVGPGGAITIDVHY